MSMGNMLSSLKSGDFKGFYIGLREWLADNIVIKRSKSGTITGAVIAIILTVLTLVSSSSFTSINNYSRWILLALAFMLPILIGVICAYTVEIKSEKHRRIFSIILIFLLPILSITMTEALNGVFIYDMTYLGFFANYALFIILYFLFFALSGSIRFAIFAINPVMYGLALTHAYLLDFRGTPFLPMDFLGIKTAMNVAGTYKFHLLYNVILASYVMIILVILGVKIKTPEFKPAFKIALRGFMGLFAGTVIVLFYFTSVFVKAGVKPDFWNQSRGYKNYGFAFSFVGNTKYLFVSAPKGYNANEIGDYFKDVDDNKTQTVTPSESAPNIICIMNESLADLKILGDFQTNMDYMPFMHSLTENTIKGNLYVPVVGAGTSNTEFEFLTGASVAFLPSGSNAYMLYIKDNMPSLVSTLKAQGYSSMALHPYYASGWNRTSVYNFMGFDRFVSLENLIDISILKDFSDNGNNDPDYFQALIEENYPDRSNMLIRQYVSDSYNYKLIIDDYEKRDKSKPYFTFNVTMQNHGGYTINAANFDECISITSANTYYTKASKYLSLIKASDDAFAELINYFKNVEEPTLICMFGDHHPTVEPEFISEIMGVDSLNDLSLEQVQQRHITPFFIWANYDIEEKFVDKLSSNYLASYLLKVAGLKMTDYDKYLLNLSETLPVVDSVGYIDNQNNYYRLGDETEYTETLSQYEKIQYNLVFDKKNRQEKYFYINSDSTAAMPE